MYAICAHRKNHIFSPPIVDINDLLSNSCVRREVDKKGWIAETVASSTFA